jgi:ABC-type amino acid transport substrate-binding protein
MKRRVLAVAALAALLLLVPTAAQAKGVSAATISGGGPVTFMPSGQPIFDTTTTGGWYQGFDGLRAQLIDLGLPNREPLPQPIPKATPSPTPQPVPATPAAPAPAWPRVAAVAAGFLVLTAAGAWTLRRRHDAREATAAH